MRVKRKTCLVCNRELSGNRTVYCSETCHITRTRDIAHTKIHLRRKQQGPKTCQVCFKVFTPGKSTQVNCSKECGKVAYDNWFKRKPKQIKEVECQICSRVFMQKNPQHKNCSPRCRQIDFREKEKSREKRIRSKTKKMEVEGHKFVFSPTVRIDKGTMRNHVIDATERFLKAGKKIERLPDSPAAKVPSVGIRGVWYPFSDEREFYTEASEGNLDPDLLEMEDNEVAAL